MVAFDTNSDETLMDDSGVVYVCEHVNDDVDTALEYCKVGSKFVFFSVVLSGCARCEWGVGGSETGHDSLVKCDEDVEFGRIVFSLEQ